MPQRKQLTVPPLACLSFRTACNALFGTSRSNQCTQTDEKESRSEATKGDIRTSNPKHKILTASYPTSPGINYRRRSDGPTVEIGYPHEMTTTEAKTEVEKPPSSDVCQEKGSLTAPGERRPCYITYSTGDLVAVGCPQEKIATVCEVGDVNLPSYDAH